MICWIAIWVPSNSSVAFSFWLANSKSLHAHNWCVKAAALCIHPRLCPCGMLSTFNSPWSQWDARRPIGWGPASAHACAGIRPSYLSMPMLLLNWVKQTNPSGIEDPHQDHTKPMYFSPHNSKSQVIKKNQPNHRKFMTHRQPFQTEASHLTQSSTMV